MLGTFLRQGDVQLDLKTNRATCRDGEHVTFSLITSTRASVRLFNEDADVKRVQLWPNDYSGGSGIVEASKPLVIPSKSSAFQIKAYEPYGMNTLHAVASAAPSRTSVMVDDFFVDKGGMKSLARKGIAWNPSAFTQEPTLSIGEARLFYHVSKP